MEENFFVKNLIMCIFGVLVLIVIGYIWFAEFHYEKGYKDAVRDFYDGKLKMERTKKNIVEYKWKEK